MPLRTSASYDKWATSRAADTSTVGEYIPDRDKWSAGATPALTSGTLYFVYFTAAVTETITSMKVFTGGTLAAATPSICRMGVFSVADNGTLTEVASIANDTTLFLAANTTYARDFTATWTKTAGVRYATGLLVVSAVATPTFVGCVLQANAITNAEYFAAPTRLAGYAGLTAWPTSPIAVGSLAGKSTMFASKLY